MRTCLVPNCDHQALKRGWCLRHYQRFLAHGSPLGGGTSPGAPKRFLLDVAACHDGLAGCLQWPFARDNDGYGRLNRGEHGTGLAHRVLCEFVNGPAPSPKHHAAHSCGQGHLGCVSGAHLRWATSSQNKADMIGHGTRQQGERHSSAKLTNADVLQILAARRSRMSRLILGQTFGVSRQTIGNIWNGRRWKHLTTNTQVPAFSADTFAGD
jgi:hypothetical protein